MGVRITVDRGRARVAFSGLLTPEVVQDALDRLLARDDFDPATPRIWDFADADGVSALSAAALASLSRLSMPAPDGARPLAAIVVSSDADFGVARMFEGRHGPDVAVRLRVFRDLDAAEAWIGAGGQGPGPHA